MTGGGLSDAELRKKFADVQPEPMFDMAEEKAGEPQKRAARPRNVYRVECPECRQDVGVINDHRNGVRVEIIRAHDRVNYSGSFRFPCPKGGAEVTVNDRRIH